MTTKLNLNQYAPVNSLSYNCIINGGFTVNQRVYASNAALSAGAYGHDRWKAGSGGGDYTFTQLAQSTTITIKTGKTLIQVIEDKNVIGGTYTLSWTGTAQARFGIDSATPSGAYAASPIKITTQTAGTVMSIEFNEGTLGQVNLANSSVALPFMPKSFDEELRACQRYCYVAGGDSTYGAVGNGYAYSATLAVIYCQMPVPMRIVPTIGQYTATDWRVSNNATVVKECSAFSIEAAFSTKSLIYVGATCATGLSATYPYTLMADNTTSARLGFEAEL